MPVIAVDIETRKAFQSIEKLDKEMDAFGKDAKKTFSEIGKSAALIGGAAVGAALVGGLYKANQLMRESIALANEQSKAELKLEAVVKATGQAAGFSAEEIKGMASELQSVTTYGDEVILGAQAIQATFKNIKGDNFQRTTEAILDMATVMGTDLKSSALQVSKALNDPIKGLDGLGRAGVQFTDSQKDIIKGMAATGDVMGAQALILSELESQFGGAAKAMRDDFGGATTAAGNAYGDLLERVGEFITQSPAVLGLVGSLEEAFIDMAASLDDNSEEIDAFISALADDVPALVGELKDVAAGVISVGGAIGTVVGAANSLGVDWKAGGLIAGILWKGPAGYKGLIGGIIALDSALSNFSGAGLRDLPGQFVDTSSSINTFLTSLSDVIKGRRDWNTGEWSPDVLGGIDEDLTKAFQEIDIDSALGEAFGDLDALASVPAVEEVGEETGKAFGEGVAEGANKELEKFQEDVANILGDISSEMQDINREGMTDQGVWDDMIKEADAYKEAADKAAESGDWETAKVNLTEYAKVMKSLPKDGVRGPEVKQSELNNAKKMVDYWDKMYAQQTTHAGKDTYAKKLKEAREELARLQAAEESGGQSVISADESRRVRLEALMEAQKGLIEASKEAADSDNKVVDSEEIQKGEEAMKDITEEVGKYGDAVDDVNEKLIEQLELLQQINSSFDASSDHRSLEGRASGGPVTGNVPYMVGEEGPELFVPRSSGSIVPNDQLGSDSVDLTPINLYFGNNDPISVMGNSTTLSQIQKAQEEQARFAA